MIKVNELKGIITARGYSQKDVANKIGIAPKTFYEKMAKGVFGSDEIELMINFLDIENPVDIFFAPDVNCEVTKEAL